MKSLLQWLSEGYRNKKNCPYWGDSGSGVIPFAKATGKFMINHRSPKVNEGDSWGIFGGGIFLDHTPYKTIEELAQTDYPKKHALEELKEETGYSGHIQLEELYVFKDNKKNAAGEPCNFYYWNFVGVCPKEFPSAPGRGHEWEEGGNSGWFTLEEVMQLNPKHFGLSAVLQHAGNKLAQLAHGNHQT